MDLSLVSAILGAQAGNTQAGTATAMLRMNADSDRAMAQMISAAAQSAKSLANVAAGVGTNLDITA